jgi:hypothetical protein
MSDLKVELKSAVSHGLEIVQVWVNDTYVTEALSLAGALTFIKTKLPRVTSVTVRSVYE